MSENAIIPVGIIGAGATGLALAHQLRKEGVEFRLLEQAPRAGGVVQSGTKDGFLYEWGPNSLQYKGPEMLKLFRELGIERHLVCSSQNAAKRYIVKKGKLLELTNSAKSLLKTPLFSLGGKLRILTEPLRKRSRADTDPSVAEFVKRRLGVEVLEYAVAPFVTGIYCGVPENLSVKAAMPTLWEMEQAHGSLIRGGIAKMRERKQALAGKEPAFKPGTLLSFEGGMQTLTDALARSAGRSLRCGVRVTAIHKNPTHWTLKYRDRHDNVFTESYEHLVCCTPAHQLAELPFAEELRQELSVGKKIEHAPIGVFSMGFQKNQFPKKLEGFGFLVPRKEGRKTLGVIYAHDIFPGRAPEDHVLLSCFVGSAANPKILEKPAEKIRDAILKDLRELLGLKGTPCFGHFLSLPKAIPQYEVGYQENVLANLAHIEARHPNLHFAGSYRGGIALWQCLQNGQELGRSLAKNMEANIRISSLKNNESKHSASR